MLVDLCILIIVLPLFLAEINKKPYLSKDLKKKLAKLY